MSGAALLAAALGALAVALGVGGVLCWIAADWVAVAAEPDLDRGAGAAPPAGAGARPSSPPAGTNVGWITPRARPPE